MYKVLWADDEIEMLQAHILFLREKGYEVTTVTNGDDALYEVKNHLYDIVLLDEMMSGKDGLTTLNEIKDISPQLPVIMITKNEEESLLEDAIGRRIDDYLTKPVNPSQILMACRKILDKKDIIIEKRIKQFAQELGQLSAALLNPLSFDEWVEFAMKIFRMDIDLDVTSDNDYRQILYGQRRELNIEFGKYIERHYPQWLQEKEMLRRPPLSIDLVSKYLVPELKKGNQVIFMVIDCLRMDQWLNLEPFFYEDFRLKRDYYCSILPTATPFSRNAIFSGLFPEDIGKKHPQLWSLNEDDESLNRFERELLDFQLQRHGLQLDNNLKYIKIMNNEDIRNLEKNLHNFMDSQLLAIVVNFVDILAHRRSDLPILKDIVPDEAAFRSLTKSWFTHSSMINVFRQIADSSSLLFVTSDHGSIRGLHGTRVIGDRETSTNLRYKYGRSLKVDKKHAIYIRNPEQWKLPKQSINTEYIIAKEDYYFVYPTNYNKYLNYYRDSFQHGGVSIEEMILPIVRMERKG